MKNILFVTYDFPYPTDSGGKTRAFNLIKFGHKDTKITLLAFVRKPITPELEEEMRRVGVSKIHTVQRTSKTNIKSILGVFTKSSIFKSLYYDKKIEKKILEIIAEDKIDLIHFESYYTAFYIGDKIAQTGTKQVLGTENIEHQLYDLYTEKNAPFLTKPVLRREVRKIQDEEHSMIQHADAVVAVTDSERKYIEKTGAKNCILVENGVDIDYFSNTKHSATSNEILFIGNFSYFPNIDAVRYLYNEILPHLDERINIKIVGKNYTALNIHDKRFTFVDYVDDIREAYSGAFAMVSPIRIGGGTNFKVLESMASKTPIVADPSRINDLGATVGKNILVSSDPKDFAQKIKDLYDNQALRDEIAQNAYKFVKDNYSWQILGGKLNTLWTNL